MSKTRRLSGVFPHDPVSWPQEIRLLGALGLRDGSAVLDIGCGPGYVASALARELPSSPVVAVDHDRELTHLAAALLAEQANRVHVVTGAAERLPLPDAQFDFAVARYLFQHLQDPVAVAHEAHRVLRPGGRLAIIDLDAAVWGVAEPPFKQAPANQSGRQGGRRLPHILREAGFVDVSLDAFAYHSDDLGIAAFEPLMTPHNYEAFAAAPDPFVMMIGFVAGGVKG